jgi:hypothetical protein
MPIRYFGGQILSPFTSTQTFFAGRSEDFRREEELTRSKPLIVLALMMLSMAATAPVQVEGGENVAEDGGKTGNGPAAFEHIYSNMRSLNRYAQIIAI